MEIPAALTTTLTRYLNSLQARNTSEHTITADFFRRYDGIFYVYLDVFTKKVRFRPTSHAGTFSTLSVDFSPVETGTFGRFVLILFHEYDGNRKVWDFHRNCRKTSRSIVTLEKVRSTWENRPLYLWKIPALVRRRECLPSYHFGLPGEE